jgi:hypothetical protein
MRVQGGVGVGNHLLQGAQQQGRLTGPDGTILPNEVMEYDSDNGDGIGGWRR